MYGSRRANSSRWERIILAIGGGGLSTSASSAIAIARSNSPAEACATASTSNVLASRRSVSATARSASRTASTGCRTDGSGAAASNDARLEIAVTQSGFSSSTRRKRATASGKSPSARETSPAFRDVLRPVVDRRARLRGTTPALVEGAQAEGAPFQDCCARWRSSAEGRARAGYA